MRMYIVHHLATKTNTVPVSTPDFSTLHTHSTSEGMHHKGWVLGMSYAGDNERMSKQRWEFVFTPEEAEQFCEALIKMLPRFKTASLEELVGEEI